MSAQEQRKNIHRKKAPYAIFLVAFFLISILSFENVFADNTIATGATNGATTDSAQEALAAQLATQRKAQAEADAKALRDQIEKKNADLSQVQNQINTYTQWLNSAQNESKTLQGTIKTLDVERNKMLSSINLTQGRLYNATLTIQELSINISETENKIRLSDDAIAEMLRTTDRSDSRSDIETFLSQQKLSDMLDEAIQVGQLRDNVSKFLTDLRTYKADSLSQKAKKEAESKKLAGYKSELVDQKIVLDKAKQEKNDVLIATRNRESEYQKILNENLARKNALERDLVAYEDQLTRTLTLGNLPKPGSEPLLWPLDLPSITQHFGVTEDSKRLYASGSHNGIDLRASSGTRLTSPAPGTVMGIGDTDVACPKASYGKWVLIQHDNGLTTLMAHFSLIKVTQGQHVGAGELIGYSGNTGYSTGPHLHISVFASDGVSVGTLPSKSCSGRTFVMPLPTATNAYLDPELYFPKL